jgi:lactate permease
MVSYYVGPYLTDILAALATIVGLALLLRVWEPKDAERRPRLPALGGRVILRAWSPYILLVILVLLWGAPPIKALLDQATLNIPWPDLDREIMRMPPVVARPEAYVASYPFASLAAAGTATMLATLLAAPLVGVSFGGLLGIIGRTARELAVTIVTIANVVALAYVMNYAGLTATLALAFAATGVAFPFFGATLGWVGVFLTGSDTSANALFGNLQVVTAGTLGLPPSLMAAANSSGGVMGKMISLQSISIAAAATGMPAAEEAKLFRFTLKHSILLACLIGLIVTFYAYVMPAWGV